MVDIDSLPDPVFWRNKFKREVAQLRLPVHFGGIGLIPLEIKSLASYLASLAACAADILSVAARLKPLVDDPVVYGEDDVRLPARYEFEYIHGRNGLIAHASTLKDMVFSNVNDEIDSMYLVCLPPTLLEFLRMHQKYPILSKKFQKRLCLPVWKAKHHALRTELDTLGDVGQVALLDSYLAQGGGRVWTVIPSSKDLVLNAAQAEQALRLQVGAMPAAWMYCPHLSWLPKGRLEKGAGAFSALCIISS
jgi:hypothetical protein